MKCNYKLGTAPKSSKVGVNINSSNDKGLEYEKVENFDYCKACGGVCCKTAGCIFFPNDFPNLQFDTLVAALESGRVSVCANFKIELSKCKAKATPVLYLKAREVGKDKIDLFTIPTQCASLSEAGCYFSLDKRPSGGAIMIPRGDGKKCSGPLTDNEQMDLWKPYGHQLKRIVEYYSGVRLNDAISRDVENWFYDFSFLEDNELTRFFKEQFYNYLQISFPVEYKSAMERVKEKKLTEAVKEYIKK